MSVILTCVAGSLLVVGSGLVLHLVAKFDGVVRPTPRSESLIPHVTRRRAA